MSENPHRCPVCDGPMNNWESTGFTLEAVRKLVRDAYDEGYGLGSNENYSQITVPFEESLAYQNLQDLDSKPK
jgi:hypothetical protein